MQLEEAIELAFERLKSRVLIGPGGCWIWQGSVGKDLYGAIKVGGKSMATHRLAYIAAKGPIPRGKVVRHTCDVRSCCNPDHLLIGDHEDNNQDAIERGRNRQRRVLTADEQAEAVSMRKAGATKRQIAEALRCNWYAVSVVLDASGVDGGRRPGRPKGSKNHVNRISDEVKDQIRSLYATGKFTQEQLAQRFGCDQTYVSLIVRK